MNTTAHPTAAWTLQQPREAIPSDHEYRFIIHDRDSIFSSGLDQSVRRFRLRVLKSPVRCPKGNSLCERTIGSLRRECLDFMIPLTESHLRRILKDWQLHFNEGRPHMSLGPGIPDPPAHLPAQRQDHRHQLLGNVRLLARPILGGLHHEYGLENLAA